MKLSDGERVAINVVVALYLGLVLAAGIAVSALATFYGWW